MTSRIQLAIVWLSVPKRGAREEAGKIPGAQQSGKEPGVQICFTCFCLSRQYYYLSIVYRLDLSGQDQALCTWESVKIFRWSARAWKLEKKNSFGSERALGDRTYCTAVPISSDQRYIPYFKAITLPSQNQHVSRLIIRPVSRSHCVKPQRVIIRKYSRSMIFLWQGRRVKSTNFLRRRCSFSHDCHIHPLFTL